MTKNRNWTPLQEAPPYQTGCEDLGIAECETCPLPRCRYDFSLINARKTRRVIEAMPLVRQGLNGIAIGIKLGLPERTGMRVYKTAREWVQMSEVS